MKKTNSVDTKTIVGIALLAAIVIVLQFIGAFIRFGIFSISLVLVPIVVGAAMYGTFAGAFLGFVFGIIVLLSGDAGAFLAVNPIGTVITVLLKGTAAGLVSALVYKVLENANEHIAVLASSIVCPIVNTGIFLLGCLVFFMPTIAGWAEGAGFGADAGRYMIVGLVGWNFVAELVINVLLSNVILRIIKIGKKM